MYPIQMKLKKNDKVVSVYNISAGVNGATSIATYYDGENWYTTNVETAIINAYYAGTIIFPEQFKDVDIEKIANEIYVKMLGEKASNYYNDMVNGGLSWRQITIGE